MKKTVISTLTILLIGCSGSTSVSNKIIVKGFAQGTTYQITYLSKQGIDYQRSIDSLLIEIDNSLSTYHPKSIISRLNQHQNLVMIDDMFKDVFLISKGVYEKTNGAFDPTVAPLVNAWGFGFENSGNTDSTTIDSLMQYVGFEGVILSDSIFKLNDGVMLDFNAVAQGYSVDVLANFLREQGVHDFLVEVGGELIASGKNENDSLWRVGIDRPIEGLSEREIEAIIHLDNKALATSGNYRKFYEKEGVKYSHTINPKTGYPVRHSLLSVTVIAENCGEADAYATAFMVLGIEKSKALLKENQKLEALLIYGDENGELQTFMTDGLENFIELNPDKK